MDKKTKGISIIIDYMKSYLDNQFFSEQPELKNELFIILQKYISHEINICSIQTRI